MQIIAHRGASKVCRENTVDAFLRASDMGADGVELDVQETLDGVIVVRHDTFDKHTGVFTCDTMFDNLVHTRLRDVFRATHGKFKKYFLDVKDARTCSNVVRGVFEEILSGDIPPLSCVLSSFNEFHLRDACREEVRTGIQVSKAYITGNMDIDMHQPKIDRWGLTHAVVYKYQINQEFVTCMRDQGVSVYAYTCNTPALAEYCRDCGCEGVITDTPDTIRDIADIGP